MSKIALVLGGTGNVGSAAVRAFLQEGNCKTVVIISRSQEKIDKTIAGIKSSLGENAPVIGIAGYTGDENGCSALKEKVVSTVGDKIDYVVSAIGFSYLNHGPMLHVTHAQMNGVFDAQFFATFGGYRTLMPLVKACDGSYAFVTGGGPDMYLGPGTGVMTIGGSSAKALAKTVMKEHAAEGVCCTEVSFLVGICPDPSVMPPGKFNFVSTADAGRVLVSVVTKKKSDVKNVVITSTADAQKVIANGALDEANGSA